MSQYSDLVIAHGAVAYWRLGEASGLVADDAGANNLDGVINATGVTYSAQGAIVGDSDTALTLNGTTGNVIVADANPLDLGDGPFTLECWVKRGALTTVQALISKEGSYRLTFIGGNLIALRRSGTNILVSSVALTDTTAFHHIVATKNATASKLYLDGVDVSGTNTDLVIANSASPLNLGSATAAANFLNGSIDEVALYNVVLTPTQVAEHFALGRTLSLTDSVTASETRSSEPGVGQSDSVTASDSQAKDVSQASSDSVTASDALSSEVKSTLSDTAAASDAVSLEPGHAEADSVTATDALALDIEVVLGDSATVSDALVTDEAAVLGDSVTATDNLVAGLVVELSLSDSVTVTDAETPVLTPGTFTLPVPEGGWKPIKLPQALRLAIRDEVFATDDYELEHEEGIPTRQQKRELALLA